MTNQAEMARSWTTAAVQSLGMTTDVETAGLILGIGRTLDYELVQRDEFPVRLIRLGRRVVVPIPELLKLLGVPDSACPGSTTRWTWRFSQS
jgi:hypothetical protein